MLLRILSIAALTFTCSAATPRASNTSTSAKPAGKDGSRAIEYNRRGIEYFHAKELEKAIDAFSAAIDADPDNFGGHMNLAFVLVAQQRYEEAERVARRAVDLRKLDSRARYLLGVALASQHKHLAEAEENLSAATAEVAEARLELSRILIEKGDFTRAMKELEQFTQQNKQTGGFQLLAK